ncbi:MAG: aspartate aminotransferase family protein [Alphaproteobacteria bacterium]|nr:aspartate aminotransferase family protein [Alphaproteobacteria bacterium]
MASFQQSMAMFAEARRHVAGGTSSNVRYGDAPVPLFFERGEGPRLHDVDGNVLIDYVLGNGPAILGHAPAPVIAAVAAALANGQAFAGQFEGEMRLARKLKSLVPSADLVRLSISGSEAVHGALRLARGFTGRTKYVKFEGQYHGWLDNVFISTKPGLNEAGARESPEPVLMSRGQPPRVKDEVIVLPWNDLDVLAKALARHGPEIAAVMTEPVMCNCGVIPPQPGYLEGMRQLCDETGTVLIFDEVITGFRLGLGGAQGRLGIRPDLTVFAKAIAGGFPLSAILGRRDIMELVEPAGQVVHSGTYNGSMPSVIAALATLEALAADPDAYRRMESRGERLMEGLRRLGRQHRQPLLVQGYGAIFSTFFLDGGAVTDFRTAALADSARMTAFAGELAANGVRTTARGVWFLSMAHGDAEIDATLDAADRALGALGRKVA